MPVAKRAANVPLFVHLMAIGAFAMLVPALFAGASGDYETGRPFLYGGVLFLGISLLIALATQGHKPGPAGRGPLLSLLGAFSLLPLMLALPVVEAVQGLSFRNAYFEMVSSITTTGATVFDRPEDIPPAVHLWRALVAWLGGLLVWVIAISIFAPMRLGGTEVIPRTLLPEGGGRRLSGGAGPSSLQRTARFARRLVPLYGALTLGLWVALLLAGDPPLVALCHAMSTLATSGITPLNSFADAPSGEMGEALILLFFVFAFCRRSFARDLPHLHDRPLHRDPELRTALVLAVLAPLAMFLHHYVATFEITAPSPPAAQAVPALWGSVFTAFSFLSTTGFVSTDWDVARSWSGLATPGLILTGLALIGGGVATTAGGVELLRVYTLYKHGVLEMDRLIHPHQVAVPGSATLRTATDTAFTAWLFFMIFAMSITAVMLLLSLSGTRFETSLILTVSMLSNTGPLTEFGGDAPIGLGVLPGSVQLVLCGAMILGRLETIAIIALLNPAFWRA